MWSLNHCSERQPERPLPPPMCHRSLCTKPSAEPSTQSRAVSSRGGSDVFRAQRVWASTPSFCASVSPFVRWGEHSPLHECPGASLSTVAPTGKQQKSVLSQPWGQMSEARSCRPALSEIWGTILLLVSHLPWATSTARRSLGCRHSITPGSASVITWSSSLCVCLHVALSVSLLVGSLVLLA